MAIQELPCSDQVVAEVRHIVADCEFRPHPLACLNEHYRRLQVDPAWTPADAMEVYKIAVALIKARLFSELRDATRLAPGVCDPTPVG